MATTTSDPSQNRCRLVTFGCKVNQYETQAIREDLEDRGYRILDGDDEEADLVVINTCTVTHRADRKARQAIYQAAREESGARIVVVGCYAENAPGDLEEIEGVDEVYPHTDKSRVGALIDGEVDPGDEADPDGMVHQSVSGLNKHTRAWLKIEDGCNLFCNFCIIPFVRGRPRSKPVDEVVDEIRTLEQKGYREVVLTGIHVGCYGQDLGNRQNLAELFWSIGEVCDIPRIRLSSIEADELDRELLQSMRDVPQIVPHIHLPLQSGSDLVLERMNRRYDVEAYRRTVGLIRDYFEYPSITTDVIVGFPGETRADFEETLELCRDVGFSKIHVFSYSDREGTKAAKMEPKVDSKTINRRVDQLERLEQLLQNEYIRSFVGKTVRVLVEHHASGDETFIGLTPRYARVQFRGPEMLTNRIARVSVDEADGRLLRGTYEGLVDPDVSGRTGEDSSHRFSELSRGAS